MKTIRNISLKWKLLIPFLFLAFAGTTALVLIGLASQQTLIIEQEKKSILYDYRQFLNEIRDKETQALSLATVIAENPQVESLLAHRNRQALLKLLSPTFERLKKEFDIRQIHFHTATGRSFLRLHAPNEAFGPDTDVSRTLITDVIKTGEAMSGLEMGETGFGIRGVTPVRFRGDVVGIVEVGQSFGRAFLAGLKEIWGIDLALHEMTDKGRFRPIARTEGAVNEIFSDRYASVAAAGSPMILIAPPRLADRSILLGPVKGYSGKTVALVTIFVDRSEIKEQLSQTRDLMIVVGSAGIAVSFLLTYVVAYLFIRPIKEIVREAQDIAEEKREDRLKPRSDDEIGTLTKALNTMLDTLRSKRREVEEHASTLRKRVYERTVALVASEEKYRTLVENVPLIVYRVLRDGTTEFVNSAMTESLDYATEEAVGDKKFWKEKVLGPDLNTDKDIFLTCFEKGEACRVERTVRNRQGRPLTFIDHAMPAWDASGRVKWVDGIMIDVTELKRLQERAIQTEEIKVLGEISARMAHEIRNPVITAGGFARRLYDSLPEDNPGKKLAQIIVEEVAKLEKVLTIVLSSTRPFDLLLAEVDVNQLLESWLKKFNELLTSKKLEVVTTLTPGIPKIQADDERLNQAFESLIKHAIVSTPPGERFQLSTRQVDDRIVVTIKHRVYRLSVDDLEKFFFPHVEEETDLNILDLPLSKIIIHRHGGRVELNREDLNILVMDIELPIRQPDELFQAERDALSA